LLSGSDWVDLNTWQSGEDNSVLGASEYSLTSGESGDIYVGPFQYEEYSEGDDQRDCSHPEQTGRSLDVWRRNKPAHRENLDLHSPDAPSQIRLSRFEIQEILGEGQHSTVYRAYDPLLERTVALKLPRQGEADSTRSLKRFLEEARSLARLCHPRIVPIFDAGREGDRFYIAMALIEGRSLAELIAQGPVPLREAVKIVADLAEALNYAHRLGIIHRDVKPANIRVDREGVAYLMDFSIAYRPDSGELPGPPGTIMGTPAYLAPERARGNPTDLLPSSDQYSLGAVLYELLCGQPPFVGSPSHVLLHVIHHEPPSPRTVQPGMPRSLAAVCRKAMAKEPAQRYPSCKEFADDLSRWLRGETPLICRLSWARLMR
jgi:serine/threonine protein kinase